MKPIEWLGDSYDPRGLALYRFEDGKLRWASIHLKKELG